MTVRTNHGWILVEQPTSGNPKYANIAVEWLEAGERKKVYMDKLGNSGCQEEI